MLVRKCQRNTKVPNRVGEYPGKILPDAPSCRDLGQEDFEEMAVVEEKIEDFQSIGRSPPARVC